MNRTTALLLCITFLFFTSCGMDPSDDASIIVDPDRCIGMTCRICEHICPADAIHFHGPKTIPVIDPDKCISCGDCIRECPEQAITGRF